MLYRSAPLGLAQFDRRMRFVRVNEALAEINGLPVEAHLGRLAWDLVPDLQSAAEPLFRRVLDQGETITGIEFTGQTAKAPGVQRDWVEQFYPLRDPETQEVAGVGIVCEEVTERKRAERTRELAAARAGSPGEESVRHRQRPGQLQRPRRDHPADDAGHADRPHRRPGAGA
ncbi:PAS domain-containing protein [Dankookia sp. P2]|uniref:PAS domain-containing protein n=1 Tax=Dankookia sp. P2 TaxID=3423955 RepID=UPI003D670DC7